MKKLYFASITISFKLLLFVFLFTSCEKNDLNIENSSEPSVDLLNDIVIAITNLEYDMQVGGDIGMSWTNQIAKMQYADAALYNPRESVIQFIWDTYYEDVVFKSKEMYDLADNEGNENIMAISLVLKAYGFSRLTDLYGDIPFIDVQTSTPVYELQENIYPEIFDMLDTAISLFNSSDIVDSGSDILYNGETNKWLKFASSLKFRCLMRVSNVMSVENELQALINSNNLFQSNEDDAKRLFSGISPDTNPIYQTIVENDRQEWKFNAWISDWQLASSDPRLVVMASLNSDGIYRGAITGNTNYIGDFSGLGEFYLSPTLPAHLLSYAELKFLKAEAAQKGFISGSASDYYNSGIEASFQVNSNVDGTVYMLSNSLGTNALEQIGTENWMSLYTQGIESWIEWRRTNYPSLMPNYFSPFLDEIPLRLTYPNSEQLNNIVNYNAAIQSQGPDELTTPIWWMQ